MGNKLRQSTGDIAKFVLCIAMLILFFSMPEASAEGIRRGLTVCAETLIPSLFPFTVISELLVRSGLGAQASRLFGRPMRKLFGISGAGAGAVILGILCGFPVGAKTAASLYRNGDITADEAAALLVFCNFPSAPFMIFAVGNGLFGSMELGALCWLSALSSGFLCSVLFRFSRKTDKISKQPRTTFKSEPMTLIFTESVTGAATSVIAVCAYVCFFTAAISCLSVLFGGSGASFRTLLFSFFELTSGASFCASLESRFWGAVLCSAAAAWSGLSVFFQISSLARGISMKPFLLSKLCSVPLSALISAAVLYIRPDIASGFPPAENVFYFVSLYPELFICAVNIFFIVSLLFYLVKLLDRCARI